MIPLGCEFNSAAQVVGTNVFLLSLSTRGLMYIDLCLLANVDSSSWWCMGKPDSNWELNCKIIHQQWLLFGGGNWIPPPPNKVGGVWWNASVDWQRWRHLLTYLSYVYTSLWKTSLPHCLGPQETLHCHYHPPLVLLVQACIRVGNAHTPRVLACRFRPDKELWRLISHRLHPQWTKPEPVKPTADSLSLSTVQVRDFVLGMSLKVWWDVPRAMPVVPNFVLPCRWSRMRIHKLLIRQQFEDNKNVADVVKAKELLEDGERRLQEYVLHEYWMDRSEIIRKYVTHTPPPQRCSYSHRTERTAHHFILLLSASHNAPLAPRLWAMAVFLLFCIRSVCHIFGLILFRCGRTGWNCVSERGWGTWLGEYTFLLHCLWKRREEVLELPMVSGPTRYLVKPMI